MNSLERHATLSVVGKTGETAAPGRRLANTMKQPRLPIDDPREPASVLVIAIGTEVP